MCGWCLKITITRKFLCLKGISMTTVGSLSHTREMTSCSILYGLLWLKWSFITVKKEHFSKLDLKILLGFWFTNFINPTVTRREVGCWSRICLNLFTYNLESEQWLPRRLAKQTYTTGIKWLRLTKKKKVTLIVVGQIGCGSCFTYTCLSGVFSWPFAVTN